MSQESLWHDTFEDALRDVVQALGGPKKVACELWPGKGPQDAARYLNHCLDPERNEKLSPGEIIWIMRAGAQAGCHVAMAFIADICLYERPRPVTKQDRDAELRKQFVDSVKQLETLRREMERLHKDGL